MKQSILISLFLLTCTAAFACCKRYRISNYSLFYGSSEMNKDIGLNSIEFQRDLDTYSPFFKSYRGVGISFSWKNNKEVLELIRNNLFFKNLIKQRY